MSDETVEVPVAELEALRDWAGTAHVSRLAPRTCELIDALAAHIPEPEPEWSDEVIEAYCVARVWSPENEVNKDTARNALTQMHRAGLSVTLR